MTNHIYRSRDNQIDDRSELKHFFFDFRFSSLIESVIIKVIFGKDVSETENSGDLLDVVFVLVGREDLFFFFCDASVFNFV